MAENNVNKDGERRIGRRDGYVAGERSTYTGRVKESVARLGEGLKEEMERDVSNERK